MAVLLYILSIVLAVVLGEVLLLWMRHCIPGWRRVSKSGAQLPKGALGWPIIGETLALTQNPVAFASSHCKRYGNIFKTSAFSLPMIVGTTPEFAKFVTSNSDLFVSKVRKSAMNILGHKTFMFKDGPPHMAIKRLCQKALLPDSLRSQVNALENIVLKNLASWEQVGTIIGKDAMEKVGSSFEFPYLKASSSSSGMWILTGVRDICSTAEGRKAQKDFERFSAGLASLPVNLPGTGYNKGLKAKADLTQYMKNLVEERRGQDNTQADVLGVLLAAQKDPRAREEVKNLDDDMIAENLVLMWFGARDTTATTLTWVLKCLVDNPDVLRRVQAEQQEILRSKDPSGDGPRLSWEDTRKMVYTHKFFQEVQRTISVIPMVGREATQDVEYEGHLIPKGWGVRSSFTFIHSDPAFYSDPESFNPDRFDAAPKPYTFLPFSAGPHMCPGIELAKLITLIVIHHLTTTYTYEAGGPDRGMEYVFFPVIVGGYPINIRLQT